MHFAITVEIIANDQRRIAIENHIWNNILGRHKRARRMTNFYVVQIFDEQDWHTVKTAFTNYVNSQTETIRFVMSPVMIGGRYDGVLPQGSWDYINEITEDR
jgi:hypothetical protein